MHGAHNTCWNAHLSLRKKCICARACVICNGAEASLPWKLLQTYLESCASIVQAVVCRPLLPPLLLSQPNPSPNAVRSRNPSKSTLAHDAVTAAVLHKHHPRWCRPHPVCLWVALALGHEAHPLQKSVFAIFRASFFNTYKCEKIILPHLRTGSSWNGWAFSNRVYKYMQARTRRRLDPNCCRVDPGALIGGRCPSGCHDKKAHFAGAHSTKYVLHVLMHILKYRSCEIDPRILDF